MPTNNNDIVEIFKEIAECLCQTESFHNSAAANYRWLALNGYKRQHMYKALCFRMKKIKLENLATTLGIQIPHFDYEKIEIPSYGSYNNDRVNSADENTYKNVTRTLYDTWLKIETENLEFFNEVWHSLVLDRKSSKDTALACFVKCLLEDSQCKVKYLTKKVMNFKGIGYNVVAIVGEQKCMHSKYKKKMEKVGKMK